MSENATRAKPAIEVTEDEWASRTLSAYGKISTYLDTIEAILMVSAMVGIALSIIPGIRDPGVMEFWISMLSLLFIGAVHKLEKLTNPINHYQTVIIKK
jgi:hypothetical protein